MNNKPINEFGFRRNKELRRSRRVVSTLLDLHNSSCPTLPHSLIAKLIFTQWLSKDAKRSL